MLQGGKRAVSALLSIVIVGGLIVPAMVSAAACDINISPNNVTPGEAANFNLTIGNNTGANVEWVDITVPGEGSFFYAGSSVAGWSPADHEGGATFTGGSIASGASSVFQVTAQANIRPVNGSWSVKVADNSSGSNPTICSVATTTISGHPANDTSNGVNNVLVTNITTSSATVTWNTDTEASSIVYYGSTSNYGAVSPLNSTKTTDHQINLSGLSPDSTYHFQAAGLNTDNTLVSSADGTFITSPAPIGVGAAKTSASPTSQTVTINPASNSDKIAPTIIVDTKLSGAYKTNPVVTGSATDNIALNEIEYSLDGGKNWLPAEDQKGQHTNKMTYKVTFPPLQDGNYDVVVRSVDDGGNNTQSAVQTLVIDRLPPLVGGSVANIGPQLVYPDEKGVITALEGSDQKVTMNAVGGPIAITLNAVPADKNKSSSLFSLRKSSDSGLWTGVMNFKIAGDFEISAQALDGAGNITNRTLFKVHVLPRAPVYQKNSDNSVAAKVTVFTRDRETNAWVVWDAAAYNQQNPQKIQKDQKYGFYVPSGTYYVKYEAAGFQTIVSRSVTLERPTILTQDIYLARKPGVYIGKFGISLPWISLAQTNYEQSVTSKVRARKDSLPTMPNFQLPQTNQQPLKYINLFGKPTIMTFINSWAPSSEDQLAILGTVNNSDIRITAVSSGESVSHAIVYAHLSSYPLPILVDNENQLAQSLKIATVPTHYFLDRHGVVKKVMVGVLSKEELIQNVEN